jgi:hypothetical protein
MKNLLLTFLVLVLCFQAQAQHRFYTGLEAGPKWTFTENITGMNHLTTEKEIGFSGAAVFGFFFPGEKFAVETSFGGSSFNFKHNMEDGPYPYHQINTTPPKGFIEPELSVSKIGLQIPLRLKSRFFQSKNEKWQAWLTGGAIFTVVDYGKETVHGNFIINDSIRGYGILISRQIDENTVSKPMDFLFGTTANPIFIVETGLETDYKISNCFLISLKAHYQSGLKAVFISSVTDSYKSPRGGQYTKRLNTSSNGSGVYLNVGLTYAFGKRTQKT